MTQRCAVVAACRVGHCVVRRPAQPGAHGGGSACMEPESLQVSFNAAGHGHGPLCGRVRRGQGRVPGKRPRMHIVHNDCDAVENITNRREMGYCPARKNITY